MEPPKPPLNERFDQAASELTDPDISKSTEDPPELNYDPPVMVPTPGGTVSQVPEHNEVTGESKVNDLDDHRMAERLFSTFERASRDPDKDLER